MGRGSVGFPYTAGPTRLATSRRDQGGFSATKISLGLASPVDSLFGVSAVTQCRGKCGAVGGVI